MGKRSQSRVAAEEAVTWALCKRSIRWPTFNKRSSVLLFAAMKMRITLFVLVVCLSVAGVRSEGEAEWEKRHEWDRQFWGTFKITPQEPVGPDGWKMTVTFPEPIRRLEVWQARIVPVNDDKTEFVLENQHWNAQLEAEETLKFPFTVTKKNGKHLKSLEVSFERLGEGSGSGML